MLVWTTDTMARRTAYASTTGRSPFTQELREKVGDFRPGFQPFVNSGGEYHEYHLVAPEKVGPLPEVEVLGIHHALTGRREGVNSQPPTPNSQRALDVRSSEAGSLGVGS